MGLVGGGFGVLQNTILLVIFVAMVLLKGFAFIDACIRPLEAFTAADKQTKPFWLVILGLSLVLQFISPNPIGIFGILGTVASAVYLVGVRPAVREYGSRRRGGSSDGPYGPW
ncbi:DUF2516 family protein [Flindersiella endophytica]